MHRPIIIFFLFTECTNGEVRLEGGNNTRQGRVEICYLGEWGTVCAEEWDHVDASVVCRQLGFESVG